MHDRAEKLRQSYGGVRKFLVFVRSAALTRIYICFVEKSEKKFSMHRASVVEMLNVDRGEAFKELPGQWI